MLINLSTIKQADGDYLSANRCYEEILSEDKLSPDHWLEYGLFCMRVSIESFLNFYFNSFLTEQK